MSYREPFFEDVLKSMSSQEVAVTAVWWLPLALVRVQSPEDIMRTLCQFDPWQGGEEFGKQIQLPAVVSLHCFFR